MRKRLCSSIAAVAVVSAATSCGFSPPLPPKPHDVTVTMREYRFDYPAIPRDRVNFQVVNVGRLDHHLSLIPLPENFPPISEQLRGRKRQVVDTLARTPNLRPGGRTSFAVDLVPGRYALLCFVVDPDGGSHALKGMAQEFRVR